MANGTNARDDMGVTPLRRYGRHLGHCPMAFKYPPLHPRCTCGLESAIEAEERRLSWVRGPSDERAEPKAAES